MSTKPSSTRRERGRPGSDLDRLIDLESRLQDFLARARTRAGERLEAARRSAEAIEDRLATDLDTRERDLEARVEREVVAGIAAVEVRARKRAERFEGISEETIQTLASKIVEQLAGGGSG